MDPFAKAETHPRSPVDNLHGGKSATQPWTVKAGAYERGDVLEFNAANKRMEPLVDATKANVVIMHDIELTVDTVMPVFVGGEDFNISAMNFNGQDVDIARFALRNCGIFARVWGPKS